MVLPSEARRRESRVPRLNAVTRLPRPTRLPVRRHVVPQRGYSRARGEPSAPSLGASGKLTYSTTVRAWRRARRALPTFYVIGGTLGEHALPFYVLGGTLGEHALSFHVRGGALGEHALPFTSTLLSAAKNGLTQRHSLQAPLFRFLAFTSKAEQHLQLCIFMHFLLTPELIIKQHFDVLYGTHISIIHS